MVSVVVIRPFRYLERNVYDGQCIEMEPIDAAVKAREGLVSLLHGRTYETRDMVSALPVQPVILDTSVDTPPVKRRRGRPRKVRA